MLFEDGDVELADLSVKEELGDYRVFSVNLPKQSDREDPAGAILPVTRLTVSTVIDTKIISQVEVLTEK